GALDDSNHEHHHHHSHHHRDEIQRLLPEELAEEADLELEGFDHDHHHHHDHHHDHIHRDFQPESTPMGVWLRAMGCSLLVSMASLVCLILLPVILFQGKPSKAVVDALAVFGAGAMLGDSFLHQLPHAFGGGHSHSHNHEDHDHAHEQSHAHSLKDLSVGLSILFGIVLFFIVEKIVRYVEDNSQRGGHSHGHHHHHHKRQDISDKAKSDHIKSDDEGKDTDQAQQNSLHDGATGKTIDAENEQEDQLWTWCLVPPTESLSILKPFLPLAKHYRVKIPLFQTPTSCLATSIFSQMAFITSLMGWLLEVLFCYMVLLEDGLELYFCSLMNFLKRLGILGFWFAQDSPYLKPCFSTFSLRWLLWVGQHWHCLWERIQDIPL
uniref:IAA-alanine resistance protein 1 n=1 Tax=Aegilops tauschii subsp. strangulata TaxID=200361 RepID=A0A453E9K1_AEGTS